MPTVAASVFGNHVTRGVGIIARVSRCHDRAALRSIVPDFVTPPSPRARVRGVNRRASSSCAFQAGRVRWGVQQICSRGVSPGPDEVGVMCLRRLAVPLLTAAPSPGLSACCCRPLPQIAPFAVAGCCPNSCLAAGVSRPSSDLNAAVHYPRTSRHLSPPQP